MRSLSSRVERMREALHRSRAVPLHARGHRVRPVLHGLRRLPHPEVRNVVPTRVPPVTSTEKVAAWRAANRERAREVQKRYEAKHADKIKARAAARYADDRDARKLKVRIARYKRLYGITVEQFDKMMELQGGACAICGRIPKPGRLLHVDHDHRNSHRVRGLLCAFCNLRVLGRGREDAECHESAAVYLRSTFDGRNL